MNGRGLPPHAADLSRSRGIEINDWHILPILGTSVGHGRVAHFQGDHFVTFVDMQNKRGYVAPYERDALVKLRDDIDNALQQSA